MRSTSSPRLEVLERIKREEEQARERLKSIAHKVAVLSVKGGVGKSFVTANLAVALTKLGRRVGVLDADVHGPSIPRALGLRGVRLEAGPDGIIPAKGPLGVKVVSIGLLVEGEDKAVVWRGPLKSAFIRQILAYTSWGELDYLLVDLPPGTGDEQLTIAQLISGLDGFLVVTMPNQLSESVVSKAITFAKLLGVPILGIVENMSYFRCPNTGKLHYIFGRGGGERLAKASGAPLLAKLPIDPRASETMDRGEPIVLKYPDSELSKAIASLAEKLVEIVESATGA